MVDVTNDYVNALTAAWYKLLANLDNGMLQDEALAIFADAERAVENSITDEDVKKYGMKDERELELLADEYKVTPELAARAAVMEQWTDLVRGDIAERDPVQGARVDALIAIMNENAEVTADAAATETAKLMARLGLNQKSGGRSQ